MQSFFALAALLSAVLPVLGHDHHDHGDEQMPMDYVKYPYQAKWVPHDDG
jgi:hypothetical protein